MPVEPAQRHAAVGLNVGPVSRVDDAAKRRDQLLPRLVGEALRLGGHLPGCHPVMHPHELAADGTVARVVQVVE